MNSYKLLAGVAGFAAFFLAGCTGVPLHQQSDPNFRDATVSHPHTFFQETPESRSIIAGSTHHANLAACSFIQRYRVATNADFTSTMNMFKNRAFHMGAERIVVVQHFEVDPREAPKLVLDSQIVYAPSGMGTANGHLSVLIGDLYDCPCNRDSCRTIN